MNKLEESLIEKFRHEMNIEAKANVKLKLHYEEALSMFYEKCKELEQENKILRDALAFYGDKDNWRDIIEEEAYGNVSGLCAGVFDSIIYEDCDDTETGGKLARETLAQLSAEKGRIK